MKNKIIFVFSVFAVLLTSCMSPIKCRIDSSPQGARVEVNELFYGTTPLEFTLSRDVVYSHVIRTYPPTGFEKPGWACDVYFVKPDKVPDRFIVNHFVEFKPKKTEPPKSAEPIKPLEPKWGWVTFNITSIPPDGFVSIDNNFIGTTPAVGRYGYVMPNGQPTYTITVTPPASDSDRQLFSQTKTITLGRQSGYTDGTTVNLHFDLRLQTFAPRQQIDINMR